MEGEIIVTSIQKTFDDPLVRLNFPVLEKHSQVNKTIVNSGMRILIAQRGYEVKQAIESVNETSLRVHPGLSPESQDLGRKSSPGEAKTFPY